MSENVKNVENMPCHKKSYKCIRNTSEILLKSKICSKLQKCRKHPYNMSKLCREYKKCQKKMRNHFWSQRYVQNNKNVENMLKISKIPRMSEACQNYVRNLRTYVVVSEIVKKKWKFVIRDKNSTISKKYIKNSENLWHFEMSKMMFIENNLKCPKYVENIYQK